MAVTVYSALNEIPQEVRSALSYPAVSDFFCSLNWFESLLAYGGCIGEPRVYVCRRDRGGVEGALYCLKRGRALFGLTNFYSVRFGPTPCADSAKGEERGELVRMVVNAISAERPRWNKIELRYLVDPMGCSSELQRQLSVSGYYVTSFKQYDNWYLKVRDQAFPEYWAARPSRLKNTVRRRQKKAGSDRALDIRIHARSGPELDAAIQRYEAIYTSSWKGKEAFPEFISNLIRVAAESDVLRLGELLIEGEPAASQIWILSDGRALIYKLAYDERFADLSVGSILSYHLFEHVLSKSDIVEIDYGIGSERYKQDWMSEVRDVVGLEAYCRRSAAGVALIGWQAAKSLAKELLFRSSR